MGISIGQPFFDRETTEVAQLHEKFGFPVMDSPQLMSYKEAISRWKFMGEELQEFFEAACINDLAGMADALIDLVYVAKGTAVQLGLPWGPLWRDVHGCNLQKEVGPNPRRPWMEFCLIKPDGWVSPSTSIILKEYGYEPSTDHS